LKIATFVTKAVAAGAVGLIALTGCSTPGNNPAGANGPVVIQYNPTLYSWAGIIAQNEGFFKKNGVNAELKQIDNGTLATTALASGDITMAFQDLSLVSPYLNKGQKFTAITATGQLSWDVVAPKNSSSPTAFPASVASLKGKKIGVPSLGSVAYYYAQAYLKAAGVDPSSVQFVAVGPFAQVPAVIATGQVDAAVVTPDQTYQLEKAGSIKVLFSTVKDRDKVDSELAKVIGTPGAFYFAQSAWATKNPGEVKKVQKAIAQADVWAHDPANLPALTSMLQQMKLLPANITDQKALQNYVAYAVTFMSTYASAANMQAYVDFWKSNGLLKADVTGAGLLSPTMATTEEQTVAQAK
jgi:NitT/TauT family transport system substrate-binding protein